MDQEQSILIRHQRIGIPAGSNQAMDAVVAGTLISNLAYYGYCPSADAFHRLRSLNPDQAAAWWSRVKEVLEAVTGADKKMDRFVVYKNFPAEVLAMSEAEYWVKQILMYWGLPNELFTETEKDREPMVDKLKLKVLQIAEGDALEKIFHGLLNAPVGWVDAQKEDALFLLENRENPDLSVVQFKENMVLLARRLMETGRSFRLSSGTDILRLAAGLSDADISLRAPGKFRRFKRPERRALLALIEHANDALDEDIARRSEIWKRLFYALHPGDYRKHFVRAVSAYDRLYRGEAIKTFSGKLEFLIENGDAEALALVRMRPGEFLRRLHKLVRIFGDAAAAEFVGVLPKLSLYQMLKLRRYLEMVNLQEYRLFPPGGNWTKLQVVKAEKSHRLNEDIIATLTQALSREIKQRVDEKIPVIRRGENLEFIKLQGNDSELTPYGRGTVFPIPADVKFIRTASYWATDPKRGNIWYDNGWNFFGDGWKYLGVCCWTDIKFGNSAVFSGDPTNSKDMKGRACQMIDLYLEKLDKKGVRYAVWNLLCFNRVSFDGATEVFAALQWGKKAATGKLFEPARCQLSFPVRGANLTKYIAYIDIPARKLVYMDANLYGNVGSAAQNGPRLEGVMPAFTDYLDMQPGVDDLFRDTAQSPEGMLVTYDDADHQVDGEPAYVFAPSNKKNNFEPFVLNSLF